MRFGATAQSQLTGKVDGTPVVSRSPLDRVTFPGSRNVAFEYEERAHDARRLSPVGGPLTAARGNVASTTAWPERPGPQVLQSCVPGCRCTGCGHQGRGHPPDGAPGHYGAPAHRRRHDPDHQRRHTALGWP
jgi:hypothetical protein